MAEKLCTLRTKGGGGAKYTETSLWTNPSPNADFTQTTVTLSDSISNYKYIAIKWKVSTSLATTSTTIVLVDDFKSMLNQNGDNALFIASVNQNGWARTVFYVSDTSITISTGYRLNAQGNSGSSAIPLEILGLNELAHGQSGGPMFEITGTSSTSGSSYYYIYNTITNDSSLISQGYGSTATGTVTVLRAAKGKLYFNAGMRGNAVTRPTFTIHNTTYDAYSLVTFPQSGIDIEFAANDTISFSIGKGGYFFNCSMTFVEDA